MLKRMLAAGGVAVLIAGLCLSAYATQVVHFLSDETNPYSQEVIGNIIAAFEQENPDITVEMEYVGFGEIVPTLMAKLRGGTPPELAKLDIQNGGMLWDAEALLPLNDVVEKVGTDNFSSTALDMWITEDISFCEAAKAAGYKIYVDTRIVSPHLTIAKVDGTVFSEYVELAGLNENMIDIEEAA